MNWKWYADVLLRLMIAILAIIGVLFLSAGLTAVILTIIE